MEREIIENAEHEDPIKEQKDDPQASWFHDHADPRELQRLYAEP